VSSDLPLLASGRDADIFALGTDRVVRRSRKNHSMRYEARVMAHVRAQGYPVPEVFDVSDDGLELVMARVDGETMIDVAARRPWLLRRFGAQLGDLHARLHALDAPDWLHAASVGEGDKVVHMDLHPFNVLMAADGPVVIDWTNAARGNPAVDATATWILLASGEVNARALKALTVRYGRGVFVKAFLRTVEVDDLRRVAPEVVEWKCKDLNMTDQERARMRELISDEG
jgi:tRNA A-37 threonylcarbamoyl transferase component Bud32